MLLNVSWRTLGLAAVLGAACGPAPAPGTGGAGGAGGFGGGGGALPASRWPGLGYDLASSFNNPQETALTIANARNLALRWQTTQYGTVSGAAAVVGDTVYVLSGTGLYALRASTGQVIWQNLFVKGTASPTYSDGVLFVNDGVSVLRALNATNGQQLWQVKIDPHAQA
ncbi:MAG TPA: PQQ-binding-like beta-propeller repeat protein, partial [Polyangiaceae bacterium]|nr:PQQ-binding-like beta-propeller repeat protein [Polyangiaceae bacterium]